MSEAENLAHRQKGVIMNKKIKDYLIVNKKFLFAVTYSLIAGMFFFSRNRLLYSHMPAIESFPMAVKAIDSILIAAAVIGLIALIQCLRCPPHLKRRFKRAVERAKLHTGINEYPELVSVKSDVNRDHQQIYKIKNRGNSISSFQEKIADLEVTLEGQIGQLIPCRNHSHTLMEVMPFRYVRPTIIDSNFS